MNIFIGNLSYEVNEGDLTTTPKRGGIKGDPKRVRIIPTF